MAKILILGGGFGGVRTALDLNKKLGNRSDINITLVDRNNYQIFYPSLYEVATAFVLHDDPFNMRLRSTISIPFSEIFTGTKVETIQAEVTGIDLGTSKVSTQGGRVLDYDYLVLAFGAEVSTFGIPGVSEYAYKFKTVDDAIMLFQDIEEIYKTANESKLPIKYLVIGAGFTGIELAGELSLCTAHIAHKHKIYQDNCTKLMLVEAAPQMLPMVSDQERDLIKKRLSQLGVEVMENTAIAEVIDNNTVKLKDGKTLNGDFIIWSAGVKAPEMLKSVAGLGLNPAGRLIVNESLQTERRNIFAIGDSMIFTDPKTQKPVPQMAYMAIKQGAVVAENITQMIEKSDTNLKLKNYEPTASVWVAPVGGKYGVAHAGFHTFKGFTGYLIRELIDARYFLSILSIPKALKLISARLSVFLKND